MYLVPKIDCSEYNVTGCSTGSKQSSRTVGTVRNGPYLRLLVPRSFGYFSSENGLILSVWVRSIYFACGWPLANRTTPSDRGWWVPQNVQRKSGEIHSIENKRCRKWKIVCVKKWEATWRKIKMIKYWFFNDLET